MLTGKGLNHRHLRLRDLLGIDASHTDSAAVNLHHDSLCLRFRSVKNLFENQDDKLHRRIIIVVEENLVHGRFPGLLSLSDGGIGLFLFFTQN